MKVGHEIKRNSSRSACIYFLSIFKYLVKLPNLHIFVFTLTQLQTLRGLVEQALGSRPNVMALALGPTACLEGTGVEGPDLGLAGCTDNFWRHPPKLEQNNSYSNALIIIF